METYTLDQIKAYEGTYQIVPLCRTIYADIRTPVEVLRIVKAVSSHCYLLESMEDAKGWGRYTFIGYDPQMGLYCKDGVVHIKTGTEVTFTSDHPQEYISQILHDNKAPKIAGMPPFTGGLVGYFAYDFIKYAEPTLHLQATDDDGFYDFDLMLFDKVIVFDHLEQKIHLIVNVRLDSATENYNRAIMTLDMMEQLLRTGKKAEPEPLHIKGKFKPLFSKEAYCHVVEQAKEYIREGDIFQVVLANRHMAEADGSLLDTYRILRTVNPSPYMFFFSGDQVELAGSSPETLTRLTNGELFTFPLAGSRRRVPQRKKIWHWSRTCYTTPRSWPNTTCLSIWGGTTWDGSARSARST